MVASGKKRGLAAGVSHFLHGLDPHGLPKERRRQEAMKVNRMNPFPAGSGDEPLIFHNHRRIIVLAGKLKDISIDHDSHRLLVAPETAADPLGVLLVLGNWNDGDFVVKGHNALARATGRRLGIRFFRSLVVFERDGKRSNFAHCRRTRRRPSMGLLNDPQLCQQP